MSRLSRFAVFRACPAQLASAICSEHTLPWHFRQSTRPIRPWSPPHRSQPSPICATSCNCSRVLLRRPDPVGSLRPRITVEEMFTDNVLQSPTNRRWDLLTIVNPGISIVGDTPNVQLHLNYSPQGRLAARTPSENSITNQLVGSGTFTIVPDLFYINANAFAGAGPTFGGFGSVGLGLSPQLSQPGLGASLARRVCPNRTRRRPPISRSRHTCCIASVILGRPRWASSHSQSSSA